MELDLYYVVRKAKNGSITYKFGPFQDWLIANTKLKEEFSWNLEAHTVVKHTITVEEIIKG